MKLKKEKVLSVLHEFHGKLAAMYGKRLKGVYLYGSYAREDAREDSDIDVAVVLSDIASRWEEREKIGDITADLSLRENCLLTAFVMSEAELRERPYAIHRSIEREGIAV
jgi:predicted nucleotidyltransferase